MKRRFYSLLFCCVFSLLGMFAQEQRTNLPALYINTFGNAPVTSKTDYVYATVTYVDGDSVAVYDSVSIRGRGNSTWNFAKKPYRLKFEKKTKFLGKGYANAKKWTLLANHADKTLMRNALAFEIGRYMELPFNPAARFVDLTLNGNFLGNYQISDQVDVRKKRVNVAEQDYPLPADADITGGYLLEVDGFGSSEPVHFRTGKNLLITVKYPADDEIEERQVSYIKDYVQQFENALFSTNYKDPEQGYRAFVDSATLINWYLATELTGNVDGFWSTYIYKDRNDPKLYFGPLWDYDIAFNNCNRTGTVTNYLMMDKGFGSDLTKVWMQRMWADKWFLKAVNDRWKQLVESGIKAHLLGYIDSLATELDRSQALNYTAKSRGGAGWSINSRVYNEIVLFTTYQGGVDYLKDFIDKRVDFLSTTFASVNDDDEPVPEPDPSDPFVPDEDFYYHIFNKGTNMLLDVSGEQSNAGVVMWNADYERLSQQWEILPLSGDYVQVVNRGTGMALADVATYSSGSYAVGSQLVQLPANEADTRQAWSILPVSTGDLYVFVNRRTNLAMNNSGGGSANGNRVLSYTNDDRNETSLNRQWIVEKFEPKDFTALDRVEEPAAPQYTVYYNPADQSIHFEAEDMAQIDTEVALYTMNGLQVRTFRSTDRADVSDLPTGIYLVRWLEGSQVRSVKFVKE